MKKRCFSFWFVNVLFFSSGIVICAEKKPDLAKIEDVERQKQADVTNKWLWNAAKVVGGVAVVGLVAYNFLTALPTNLPVNSPIKQDMIPDTFSNTPVTDVPVSNPLISNTAVNVQSQISVQENFRRRVVFNQLRTMAVSFALQGIFNAAVFTALSLFSLPASPFIPGGLLVASALLTPGAYYYRETRLPSEARDISLFNTKHPTSWDYLKRLLTQKMLGESSDLWKY